MAASRLSGGSFSSREGGNSTFSRNSPARAAEIAFRFHHGMTLAGGKTILPLIYSSFQVPCTALWIRFCRKYGVAELRMNMQELHRRMLNRDKAGALQWVNDYLGQAVSGSRQIYEA